MTDEAMMVETGPAPAVHLGDVPGDVAVRGWDETSVSIETEEAAPEWEQTDDVLTVHLRGGARLRVPRGASLHMDDVRGDVAVRGVDGTVTIDTVSGDVALSGTGAVTIDTVSGDLAANGVAGDLAVATIGGDAAVRDLTGAFAEVTVGGDLALRGVKGDVSVAVGSDAAVSLEPVGGGTYRVSAGSDIACSLPDSASVDVTATAGSGVTVSAGGETGRHEREWSGTLGDGGATLELNAGAGVIIGSGGVAGGLFGGDFGERMEDFGERMEDFGASVEASAEAFAEDFGKWAEDFSERMRAHALAMAEQVGARLSQVAETLPEVLMAAGMSPDEAQRIGLRVQRSAERAGRNLEVKMKDVTDRAERTAERLERQAQRQARRQAKGWGRAKGGHRGGHWRGGPFGGFGPFTEPTSRVTDEERMTILRLVEQEKISVEEAARLLAALDGRAV